MSLPDPALARPESEIPTEPEASEHPLDAAPLEARDASDFLRAVALAWLLSAEETVEEDRLQSMMVDSAADEGIDLESLTTWAMEEKDRLGLKSYEEQADERSTKGE